jgi:hypothetical protein
MTDQLKPDQPGGDALDSRETAARIVETLGVPVHKFTMGGPLVWLNTTREILAEAIRATPTRDGAKGADPCPYCKREMRGADDCEKCGMGSPARPTKTAPPQPAPDAMREVLKEIVTGFDWCMANGQNATMASVLAEDIEDARAVLAAPVPPADGAPRPCTCHPDDSPPVPCAHKYALRDCKTWDAALWALISTLHSHVAEDKRPAGWSDFSDEQIDRLKRSAEAFLRALSPSGTGAAEPVALEKYIPDIVKNADYVESRLRGYGLSPA